MKIGDVSRLTKREALAYCGRIDETKLTKKEALAIQLVDGMVADPHTVDDRFFEELKTHYSEGEIVELVFAAALFIWGNHFNITMRLDTAEDSPYTHGLQYAAAAR